MGQVVSCIAKHGSRVAEPSVCGPSEFQIGILQLHNVAQPLYEFMIDYPAQSGSDNASTRCGRHGELELSREAQFRCVRRGEIVWVQLLEVVGNVSVSYTH